MGILRLLDDCPDLCVVGEASSGDEALFLVKNHNPDVLILDMKMPGMDGWEVTRRLKQMNAHVKIIVLSAHSSQPFPTRVLQMGAMGYLSKESAMDEMVMAIRQVARGQRYVSAKIAQQMAINSLSTEEGSPFERLSEREMQVLLMLAKGLSVSLIAKTLFLSSKTVNGYRYRMFEKLNIKNDVELIFLAMKHGVIQQPTVVE